MKDYFIHPREVADKSSKENLFKAIEMALNIESDAIRRNTQSFNSKRYLAIKKISDYEELKTKARQIKEWSIEHSQELLQTLKNVIESRGGKVFIAKNPDEATEFIKDICLKHNAKLIVKSKSITSEEIGLNSVLEKSNIEVAETDLAEFILQVSKEQPSHIVAPAIHRSRERISELFKNHFVTDKPLNTGEELTQFARDILRNKFLSADIGISGANLIAAEEGAILLVESEGNIRLTTQLPAVHIAIAGIEKIIKSKKDFGVFIQLLAASGTGQLLTSYTNILEPPIDLPLRNFNGRNDVKREFYLVLIDNGRTDLMKDEELKEALYCIRCSACMNVCANFQTVGGHAFGGEVYTGGIGAAWTYLTTHNLEKARFAELCTGCSRCIPNCPVKIDIPKLNSIIKDRLYKKNLFSLQKFFFANYSYLAKIASIAPSFINRIINLNLIKNLITDLMNLAKERTIPQFSKNTFSELFKRRINVHAIIDHPELKSKKIIVFADVYTNYNNPQVGLETCELLEKLGLNPVISKVMDDGRASYSQGLIKLTEKFASRTSQYLKKLIDEGYDILFIEPSVLTMIKYDYKKFIKDDNLFGLINSRCYDIFEYLNMLIDRREILVEQIQNHIVINKKKIFYHEHCQMRSLYEKSSVIEFFNRTGINMQISTQECCGMAGSFGYKKHFYDISKNLGLQLIDQLKLHYNNLDDVVILANGISCREQLSSFSKVKDVYHPVVFLNRILKV
ncbi:LUD domain-containing protein [Rosettibacter firmus]|uniref:LUD domain-containing protein n=1 Tax=Rosettibacter firmus TaxID=3111522 RepID=UPI00336C1507